MGRAMPVVRMRHSNYYKLDCSATRPLAACVTVTCRGRSSVYRSPLTRLHYRNLLCCSDPLPYTLPRDGAASAAGASAADVSDPRKATYRLRYFDIRGLGEPIRMIFRYAGVPFEDVRIRQDQWPDLQAATKFGKLPELTINGRTFAQSAAIGRYLGKKFGLDASTDLERARLDEMVDLLKDMSNDLATYIGTAVGFRDGDRQALRKAQYLPAVRKYLPLFERRIEESGGSFLAPGNKPTWADFFLEEYLCTLRNVEPHALRKYPALRVCMHRVRTLPELEQYLRQRPHSVI